MRGLKRHIKTVAIDLRQYLQQSNTALTLGADSGMNGSAVLRPRLSGNVVKVGDREYKLFFLCGHPRSGTHWTGALLNRHPAINCRGEFRFEALRKGYDDLVAHDWHACHGEPSRTVVEASFQDAIRNCMGSVAHIRPGSAWIGDRTPRALDVYIPGAPHFVIFRDGRDVAVSWAIHQIRTGSEVFARPEFRDRLEPLRAGIDADPTFFKKNPTLLLEDESWVRHLASTWARHVQHDLVTLERIRAGDINATVMDLRYERLHRDPEGERAKMYEFLGLNPERAYPMDEHSKTTPGFAQDDHTKFFRFGRVGEWATYFGDAARRWFKDEAGPELIRLGYEDNDAW